MLVNEALRTLAQADLNQRYAESFIPYDGEVVYVQRFENGKIYFTRKKAEGATPFKWDKLDIFRPTSQWYNTPQGPQYLQYFSTRQYNRGFNRTTCGFFTSDVGHTYPTFDNLTACFYNEKPFKRSPYKITVKELQTKIDNGETVQLHPMVLVTPVQILFRKTNIGNLKDAKFNLYRPEFSQELTELIENPVIINQEGMKDQKTKSSTKKDIPNLKFAIPRDPVNIIVDDVEAVRHFREFRENLRGPTPEDKVYQVPHIFEADVANAATRKALFDTIYGTLAMAFRDAKLYKKSFVWYQREDDVFRIGFNP